MFVVLKSSLSNSSKNLKESIQDNFKKMKQKFRRDNKIYQDISQTQSMRKNQDMSQTTNIGQNLLENVPTDVNQLKQQQFKPQLKSHSQQINLNFDTLISQPNQNFEQNNLLQKKHTMGITSQRSLSKKEESRPLDSDRLSISSSNQSLFIQYDSIQKKNVNLILDEEIDCADAHKEDINIFTKEKIALNSRPQQSMPNNMDLADKEQKFRVTLTNLKNLDTQQEVVDDAKSLTQNQNSETTQITQQELQLDEADINEEREQIITKKKDQLVVKIMYNLEQRVDAQKNEVQPHIEIQKKEDQIKIEKKNFCSIKLKYNYIVQQEKSPEILNITSKQQEYQEKVKTHRKIFESIIKREFSQYYEQYKNSHNKYYKGQFYKKSVHIAVDSQFIFQENPQEITFYQDVDVYQEKKLVHEQNQNLTTNNNIKDFKEALEILIDKKAKIVNPEYSFMSQDPKNVEEYMQSLYVNYQKSKKFSTTIKMGNISQISFSHLKKFLITSIPKNISTTSIIEEVQFC